MKHMGLAEAYLSTQKLWIELKLVKEVLKI